MISCCDCDALVRFVKNCPYVYSMWKLICPHCLAPAVYRSPDCVLFLYAVCLYVRVGVCVSVASRPRLSFLVLL